MSNLSNNVFFRCNNDLIELEGICEVLDIEVGILEAKTECYAKDKVESLPFF